VKDLGRRGVNELHVEAGYKLNGSLLREGLVDELLVYLAPRLLGPGQGMAGIGPLQELDQATPLAFDSVEQVGPDLRVIARIRGRDRA
jgi:Pyrimidine reductase, riboflavin biosynthesis